MTNIEITIYSNADGVASTRIAPNFDAGDSSKADNGIIASASLANDGGNQLVGDRNFRIHFVFSTGDNMHTCVVDRYRGNGIG